MKPRTVIEHSSVIVLLLLALSAAHSSACPMCMGAQDGPTASAVNNAIFFMFGALGLIFTGIGAVALRFYWRARTEASKALEPGTPELEFKEANQNA